MKHQRISLRAAWPWLLVVITLVLGSLLGACASGGSDATPTPTKTPRPAEPAPH